MRKLQELRRIFPDYEPYHDHNVSVELEPVKSPIPTEVQRHLSDENWIRIMHRYNDTTGREFNRREVDFHESIKEQPERFYRLLDKLDPEISPYYFAAIINGLAGVESIPANWLFDAVVKFSEKITSNFRIGVSKSIAQHATKDVPFEVIDILTDWALHDPSPDPKNEIIQIEKSLEQHSDSHDTLLNIGINSVRGVAVEAICDCLLKRSVPDYDRAFQFLETVSADPSDAVRVITLNELAGWQDATQNTQQTINLLKRTIDEHPLLLISPIVQHLLYWMSYSELAAARPYIDMLLTHETNSVREAGARIICARALLVPELVTQADWIINHGDSMQRKGAAQVYAQHMSVDQFALTSQHGLSILINDEDEIVRKEVAHCFSYLRERHLEGIREFILEFISSAAIREGAYSLLDYLTKIRVTFPDDIDWTLEVVRRVVNIFGREMTDFRTSAARLQRHLTQILRSLYDASEYYPDKQKQVMLVFDDVLRLGIREAFQMLEEEDKEWSYS